MTATELNQIIHETQAGSKDCDSWVSQKVCDEVIGIQIELQKKYSDFVNQVLVTKLKAQERYLTDFNNLFARIDSDHDGIIDSHQFETLLEMLNIGLTPSQIGNLSSQVQQRQDRICYS